MTKLTLNEAQLKAICGGTRFDDQGGKETKPPLDTGIGSGNSGGGGIDTVTLQRDRELPGT